jgi:Uma2 family endonuclease
MTSALGFWPASPSRGWRADDLDHLPTEGPNGERLRYELIDGALYIMSPQRRFHARTIRTIPTLLNSLLPDGWEAEMEMSVRLGDETQVTPDIVVFPVEPDETEHGTYLTADEIVLIVEVVSPESRKRDRKVKPARYAEAGIPHFWRIEDESGRRVVYVHELDPRTKSYLPTGIFHGTLSVSVPFPIELDLDNLPR